MCNLSVAHGELTYGWESFGEGKKEYYRKKTANVTEERVR